MNDKPKLFSDVACKDGNEKYEQCLERCGGLKAKRTFDSRSDFERDYTRILHCLAYRRLKHKTQVFFNIGNDHICTRMEHVAHVESVSTTIAKALGLNIELTRAIAIGHDLGHAPFGHEGEKKLNAISEEKLGVPFFHERNGVRFVDDIELLEDDYRINNNLHLTYGVRDGIISHCGEVDDNGLFPRAEAIDLMRDFTSVGKYSPYTWEGCVVKMSDKIAYVGRDIEDAIRLKFLSKGDLDELTDIAREYDTEVINTTSIIHNMIYDITAHSSPEKGIYLSPASAEKLKAIKKFNLDHIYRNPRLTPFTEYAELVIRQLFNALFDAYDGENTLTELSQRAEYYPMLMKDFSDWISKYCDPEMDYFELTNAKTVKCRNTKIYGRLETEEVYIRAIIDFISGMSDNYAIKAFNELITY